MAKASAVTSASPRSCADSRSRSGLRLCGSGSQTWMLSCGPTAAGRAWAASLRRAWASWRTPFRISSATPSRIQLVTTAAISGAGISATARSASATRSVIAPEGQTTKAMRNPGVKHLESVATWMVRSGAKVARAASGLSIRRL